MPFKLLLVSHGFPPQSHSGVFRASSFAKYLPEFGVEVVVLTAAESFQEVLHYPRQEGLAGVEVVRVPFSGQSSGWAAMERVAVRVPGLSGAVKNRQLLRDARSAWRLATTARDFGDVDGVLATSPPAIAAVLGWLAARSLNVPFWCDLRDPWTYQMGAKYRSSLDLMIQAGLERKVLSAATLVLANTETAREDLIADFALPHERVEVIPNGFDEAMCQRAQQRVAMFPPRQSFDVVYVGLGNYRKAAPATLALTVKRLLGIDIIPVELDNNTRSPLYVLSALADATARSVKLRETLRFRWIGPVDEPTRSLLESYQSKFAIDAPGGVDESTSVDAIFAADLLLLLQASMRRRSVERCSAIPAKTFVYLRSGRPILAALEPGELTRILSSHSGCKVVPPTHTRAIADAILESFEEWSHHDGPCVSIRSRVGIQAFERRQLAGRLAKIVHREDQARLLA